jgi:translation initiation factor 2 subunit 2
MQSFPYSYEDMLSRLHGFKTGDDNYEKINLPQLKIVRKNRSSIFANFAIFCEKLSRPDVHIQKFIYDEMGMNCSINGQKQLIIQGILTENKMESIMKKYIREFVLCKQCKGIDTKLSKENNLTFLGCNKCSAKSSLGKV